MLHITTAAAAAIEEITDSTPGCSGVRISALPEASTNGSGPSTVFDFCAVDGPGVDDEVVEEEGVHIFIEPEVAPYLDDKLLDADVDGEQVRFIVEQQ